MKKLTAPILLLSLVAVLSACVVVVSSKARNFTLASNYVLASNQQPVICDNKTTQIQYSFTFDSLTDVSVITENWTGKAPTSPTPTFTRNVPGGQGVSVVGNQVFVDVFWSPGTSPFSVVKPQAISVTPVPNPPTSRTGVAYLSVSVGGVGKNFTIPVYSGCNVP